MCPNRFEAVDCTFAKPYTPVLGTALSNTIFLPRLPYPTSLAIATYLTMPFGLAPIRQASKKLATKLKPMRLGKGMRSTVRGVSRIPLNPVVAGVHATANGGSCAKRA